MSHEGSRPINGIVLEEGHRRLDSMVERLRRDTKVLSVVLKINVYITKSSGSLGKDTQTQTNCKR